MAGRFKGRLQIGVFTAFLFGAVLAALGQAPPETVTPAPAAGPTTTPAPTPTPNTSGAPAAAPDKSATSAPVTNEPADADASHDSSHDNSVDPASLLPAVPSLPPRKASLIGGTVEKMDRVRDELTIRVFGGGKMKIAFDPRTTILRNGEPALPSDLRRGDHVSIDTILNGDAVFARTIRLTNSVPGESQGVVVNYHGGSNDLEVRDRLSPRVLKLRLTPQTRVVDQGKATSAAELVRGTLVSIKFGPQHDGHNTVQELTVLAVPGRNFTFVGHVTNLDLRAGLIVLTSATDGKSYEIYFDPSIIKLEETVAQAADVTVLTRYDGSRYVASSVKVN